MSCTYKVSTLDKKSIVETYIFHKTIDGELYEARCEQTWRWGYSTISGVEKDSIDTENPDSFVVTDYETEDGDLDDGVALWFYYSDNVTQEMREQFEAAWEDSWFEGVENLGWEQWDRELVFYGPLEVELLEEVEDEEQEYSPPQPGKWPF